MQVARGLVLAFLVFMMVVAMLAGCAAPLPLPPVPEPVAAMAPAPARQVPDTVASRLVKRDTAALKSQARRFLVLPGTPIATVATLEPLTRAVNRSLAVMELHHTRRGYRPADVRAARAAAEAVAVFLRTSTARAEAPPGTTLGAGQAAPSPVVPDTPP